MIRRFVSNCRGTAGAEMALVLPFLLVLMFGGFETGHFFYSEHKLVKAVRDGARYASRFDVNDLCNGATNIMTAATEDRIQLMTATGQIENSAAPTLVPGWQVEDVVVEVDCQAFVATGIYTDLGGAGPIVTVSSGSVDYPSLFEQLGLIDSSFQLSARSNAAVTGI